MATALYRLGRLAYRRWPVFILGWLILLLGVGAFTAAESKPFSESFSIAGMPSIAAAETQKELFPDSPAADKQVNGEVVVQAPEGHTLAEEPYKSRVDALVAALQRTPQLTPGTTLANPVVAGPAVEQQLVGAAQQMRTPVAVARENATYVSPLSADKRTGIISWTFGVTSATDVETGTQDYVHDAVASAQQDGLTVAAAGNGMQSFEIGHTSELIGIGIALVILLITFGSLVAAGLPILTALVGVGLGTLLVSAGTYFWDLNSNTPVLATMIGLAVGIDYALFILSRYRSELTRTGDREHAVGIAIGTSGSAVVFAGLTVVIALTALFVSGVSILGAMGAAAAVTVVLAVLLAITLLPAILGMLKRGAFAGGFRRSREVDESDHDLVNGSVRLGRGIQRAPWVVIAVIVVALVGLAKPVTDLHLGLPSDATAATGTQPRIAADLVADGWGPGKNAPMIAVLDNRGIGTAQARQAAVGAATHWLAQDSNVANAQVVQATQDLAGAVVLVTPKSGPADAATDDMLTRLQDGSGDVESRTGTKVGITGITAIQSDFSDKLSGALPLYLGLVVGLAFIILVLVFRSLVVPLVATLGFLLSVLTTLGAMVRLVQYGDFGIFDPQPIMSLMPTLLIGIVFGLAMDYQVFLTTRMRESYVHGMAPKDAIIDGFRHSGRVVTAAALIMISVFAAFAFQDSALIKSIGVGLAIAIIVDAFVVRMVLVPAIMTVLGRHAWWIPRWLDRIVPNVDVEGAALERSGEMTSPAPEAGMPAAGAGAPGQDLAGASAGRGVEQARHVTPEPRPGYITYPFPLRPGLRAQLELPEDLTANEAERLGAHLRTLVVSATPMAPATRQAVDVEPARLHPHDLRAGVRGGPRNDAVDPQPTVDPWRPDR